MDLSLLTVQIAVLRLLSIACLSAIALNRINFPYTKSKGLLNIVSPSRQEQGNVSYDVFQSDSDPTLFFTHECWMSKDALESHMQTSHFKQFGAESKELLAQSIEGNLLNQVG